MVRCYYGEVHWYVIEMHDYIDVILHDNYILQQRSSYIHTERDMLT